MFRPIFCGICAIYIWNCITDTSALVPAPTPSPPGTVSPEQCSRSFLGREGRGVITSYNYPFNYLHNLTCTYSILVTNDPETTNVVCLVFHRFSMEKSTPFCSFDYLKLEYPNLRYCADGLWMYGVRTTKPGSNVWSKDFCWIVKNTKTFDITFSSDNNINDAGFYAEYFVYPGLEDDNILPPGNLGQAPCSEDEWTCFNRRCIPRSLLCDGTDDCGDESDETYVHARCGEQNVLACDFSTGSFSDGYCGFTHEFWYRTKEPASPYGPQGDHTNGSSGFYVYSDVNQSSAFLLSAEYSLPRNKTYCLAFWYYIYGAPPAATLRVYTTRVQAYSRPEWSRRRQDDTEQIDWQKGEIVIHTQADIQIIFAAELDNSFSGVALDDVSILPGNCLGDDVSCNFESGTCGWHSMSNITHLHGNLLAALSWRPHSRVDEGARGPAWDKSSKDGSGNYLYLDNPHGATHNNRALLRGPPVSAFFGQSKCLHFWYHMSGRDSDSCELRVRLHDDEGAVTDPVWRKTGTVRNAWKEAYVTINMASPYQLVLEGLVSTTGQISVDSLLLTDGPCTATGHGDCELGQYLCAEGACINATWRCDGKQDCLDASDEDWRAGCVTAPPTTPSTRTPPVVMTTPPYVAPPTCASGYFPCHRGNKCILLERLCDRFSDCEDSSDESTESGCQEGSAALPCERGHFLCDNGRCIHDNRRCDGQDQCGDGSDEKTCKASTSLPPGAVRPCGDHQYLCRHDYACIPTTQVCDGAEDCTDGSDESEEHAGCGLALSATGAVLTMGAIIGIAVGCLLCVLIVIISVFLSRRRKKPAPRHRHRRRRQQEISTISEPSTMERHLNMLENIRSPMRMLSGLPPYSEDRENMGYTSDGTATLGRRQPRHVFPPEEPPPPYDAVIKDGPAEPSRPGTPDSQSQSRPGSSRGRHKRRRTADGHQTDESSRENIYEELGNVSTLRPTRIRNEPSSSLQTQDSTSSFTAASPGPSLSSGGYGLASTPLQGGTHGQGAGPGVYGQNSGQAYNARPTYGHTGLPANSQNTGLPLSNSQNMGLQAANNQNMGLLPASNIGLPPPTSNIGLPLSNSQNLGRPPNSTYDQNTAHPTAYNTNHQLPYTRTLGSPHGSYNGYAPENGPLGAPREDFSGASSPPPGAHPPSSRTLPHQRIRLGTQALQSRASRPQHVTTSPAPYEPLSPPYPSPPGPYNKVPSQEPAQPPAGFNQVGRHSQKGSRRRQQQAGGRLYGSSRAPQRPATASPDPLSPRAMPDPRPYADRPGTAPSPLQSDHYLYRGASGRTGQAAPRGAGYTPGDWNSSAGSQEQLILGSPALAATAARFNNHPRNGSNASSDLDSTAPLVNNSSRDPPVDRERPDELEILTPTDV